MIAILGGQAGTPEQSIRLDTAAGMPVPNQQGSEVTNFEAHLCEKMLAKHEPREVRCSKCNPRYNCHGLTFGSSRTKIDDADVPRILRDDGYVRVDHAAVLPGDVILYLGSMGDVQHSGLVVAKAPPDMPHFPLVWSKWGIGPDVIHWANRAPYDLQDLRFFRIASSPLPEPQHGPVV